MSSTFYRTLATCLLLLTTTFSQRASAQSFTASDTLLCVGDCIDYSAPTNSAIAWAWFFSGGTPASSTQENPTGICYNTPGSYTTTLYTTDGVNFDTITINNYITVGGCIGPVANLEASDSVFCERGCINFFDRSLNNPTSWTWQFPGASPIVASNQQNPVGICYPVSGMYDVILIVQNNDGIDSIRKSMYINVASCPFPTADFTGTPLAACSNTCISFSDLSLFTDTATTWNWYFPGADTATETSTQQNPSCVNYPQDGLYDVRLIVSNQYGSDTLTLYSYIRIESNPAAYVCQDTTMYFGNTYQLSAFGGVSYEWSADDITSLTATNIPDPVASPANTTTYTCSITDASGCTAVRQVTVTVLHNNDFFVPTAFSPNGDGRNDLLFLRGNNLRRVRFSVFDRWGERVFETEDPTVGWDGRYKGKELNSGVFTWVATMMYDDTNTVTESGTTTLIR